MDFENSVILAMLNRSAAGLTLAQLDSRLFDFYGNFEAADRAGMRLMLLQQACLVTKTGLPATYTITKSGKGALDDFEMAFRRYGDEFMGGCNS